MRFLILPLLLAIAVAAPAEAETPGYVSVTKLCKGTYEWRQVIPDEVELVTEECQLSFEIIGTITSDLAENFSAATEALGEQTDLTPLNAYVNLDSDGGSVMAAMEIGRTVRARQMRTLVDIDRRCLSACVLILAGGVQREINGPTGIHRMYMSPEDFAALDYEDAGAAYDAMVEKVRDYLQEMRIPGKLLEAMQAVDIDALAKIGRIRGRDLKLHARDPVYSDLLRARIIARIGEDRFREADAIARRADAVADACDWDDACMESQDWPGLIHTLVGLYIEIDMPEAEFYWTEGPATGTCRPCGETGSPEMQSPLR